MDDWKVDHITIAVKNLEKSKRLFTRIFNVTFIKEIDLQKQNVRAAFYLFNDIVIGLETPLSEKGDIYNFLQKKGEGIHHIAFQGDKLSELREELQKEGVSVIGEQEQPALRKEMFTHPKETFGLLFQLIDWEEPYKYSLDERLKVLGEE